MNKRISLLVLFVTMLFTLTLVFQPVQSKVSFVDDSVQSLQAIVNPITETYSATAVGGTEKILSNVFYGGDCEEEKPNGEPVGFYGYGSGNNYANHSYQDEVHAGNYGAILSSRGSAQYYASHYSSWYFTNYISELGYLDQDINMDLWVNAKANPDFTSGAEIYLRVRFLTDLGNYYINYYLSRVSGLPFNSTTSAFFDLRDSLDTWRQIDRNITEDFESVFPTPTLSLSYIYSFFLYTTSVSNPVGDTVLLFDDVEFTNSTGFNFIHQNGDFEEGNSHFWYDTSSGAASVYRTEDDFTQGTSAMNCTIFQPKSNGYSYLYAEQDIYDGWQVMPKGWYAEQPGDLMINFDWKYSDTPLLGSQKASFYIYCSNSTYDTYFYFILGDENDNLASYSNYTYSSYSQIYLPAEGFGSRDTWNHFSIDFIEILMSLGFTNTIPYYVGYYCDISSTVSKIQLLIDDFSIITCPTGDASFEGNFVTSPTDPLNYWQTNYDDRYVNITSDAYDGNFAANLTSYVGITSAYCYKTEMYLPVTNNQFTDFYWRLDKRTDLGSTAYSYIRLELDHSKYIYYVVGNNSLYTPINNSINCFYFVDGYNQMGSWNNIFRNFTDDVITAFGPSDYTVTQIYLHNYANGVEVISTIFDHLYFVRDNEAPIFTDVTINPTPAEYFDSVEISADVADNIQMDSVILHYKIDAGSWITEEMIFNSMVYLKSIPAQDYGTVVSFYIEAVDIYGQTTEEGTALIPHTYTVEDNTNPILMIDGPSTADIVNSSVTFTVLDVSDEGSGIANFQMIVNGTATDFSVIPSTIVWETAELENGIYTIIFRATDNAGNIEQKVYEYEVYYPPTIWESFVAFMTKWWPYLTAGAGGLLIGILVIVIVVKRKKRLAA
ncbi:MAG TPA: hypothetical protein VMZ29_01255 [Candidatus Bathyarchaeia archaeon]|nr:hypothetical protein [Candidatus Bathyarchaeia archaeon]